jgi:meiotically up-regulated gene 157 (Mug157) protein
MLANAYYAGDERLINKVEWITINHRNYVASREAPWEPAVLCTVGVTSEHTSDAVAWCVTVLPHEGPFAWDNEATMTNLRFLLEGGAEGDDMNRGGFLSGENSDCLRFQHKFVKVRES